MLRNLRLTLNDEKNRFDDFFFSRIISCPDVFIVFSHFRRIVGIFKIIPQKVRDVHMYILRVTLWRRDSVYLRREREE